MMIGGLCGSVMAGFHGGCSIRGAAGTTKTGGIDYLPLARLAWATGEKVLDGLIDCSGPIYERLTEPFRSCTQYRAASRSAKLAGALIRETLALGGQACRPLLGATELETSLLNRPSLICSNVAFQLHWARNCVACSSPKDERRSRFYRTCISLGKLTGGHRGGAALRSHEVRAEFASP